MSSPSAGPSVIVVSGGVVSACATARACRDAHAAIRSHLAGIMASSRVSPEMSAMRARYRRDATRAKGRAARAAKRRSRNACREGASMSRSADPATQGGRRAVPRRRRPTSDRPVDRSRLACRRALRAAPDGVRAAVAGRRGHAAQPPQPVASRPAGARGARDRGRRPRVGVALAEARLATGCSAWRRRRRLRQGRGDVSRRARAPAPELREAAVGGRRAARQGLRARQLPLGHVEPPHAPGAGRARAGAARGLSSRSASSASRSCSTTCQARIDPVAVHAVSQHLTSGARA